MVRDLGRIIGQAWRSLLETDTRVRPWWQARLIGAIRVVHAVARDLAEGQLTLRAMSMVYTTLLALVPLLALSFSVLKGFGVHNQVEPILLNFLAPLGDQGREISQKVIQFVDNVNARALGSAGLIVLLYTVVSLLQKVERGFNFIWRVGESRGFVQRFSEYLSVVMVGPVLLFSALGITASALNTEFVHRLSAMTVVGDAIVMLTRLLPYLLVIMAFTFVYVFVPNTRVRVRAALLGALVGGVLWETTGWAFASFVVSSSRNVAIYSGFAVLILFMVWLYLSWLILLIGASIAFYVQNPEYRVVQWERMHLGNRSRERLALQIMFLVSRAFASGGDGWNQERLARHTGLPETLVAGMVETLKRHGLLLETCDGRGQLVPGGDLHCVTLHRVLAAVRGEDSVPFGEPGMQVDARVDALMEDMEQALVETLDGLTLASFADIESASPKQDG